MNDHPPQIADERFARRELVELARAMLRGELSFLDGAEDILRLRGRIGGIPDDDPDFTDFVLIESETDHLPLTRVRSLWADEALRRIAPKIAQAERWASDVGTEACRNLISRFEDGG